VATVRSRAIPGTRTSANATGGTPAGWVSVMLRVSPGGRGTVCGNVVRRTVTARLPASVVTVSGMLPVPAGAASCRVRAAAITGSSAVTRHHSDRGSPTRSSGRQEVVGSPSSAAKGWFSGWLAPGLSASEAELDAATEPPVKVTTLSPAGAPG
jgi:hypothetical protein